MAEELKVGDVVQLKSDGPTMTIQQIGEFDDTGGRSAVCQWFSKDGKSESGVFPLSSLSARR